MIASVSGPRRHFDRGDHSLGRLLSEAAWAHSTATAVVSEQTTLTYAELNRAANSFAERLRRSGVGAERGVAVMLERGVDLLIAMVGTLVAGGVLIPLDPRLPKLRRSRILSNARPAVVVTRPDLAEDVADEMEIFAVGSLEAPATVSAMHELPVDVPPEALAYVLYTSGSTGEPKGVAVPHRAIVNYMLWRTDATPITAGERILALASIAFDVSLRELIWPLTAGGCVVIGNEEVARDPRLLAEVITSERVTILHILPSMLELILEDPVAVDALRRLRILHSSAEPLPRSVVRKARRLLPAEIHHSYGPTEAAVSTTFFPGDVPGGVNLPIGRPIANVDLYVLDPTGAVVAPGEIGELYIGGTCLARGYLKDPSATAAGFVPRPRDEVGSRLYKTGDLVRQREEGLLEFVGRIDDQLKLRGLRIEASEIEGVLRSHPAIRNACVIATGNGARRSLTAYVEAREEASLDDVRECAAQDLPEIAVPARIVRVAELPRLLSGKIDRRALSAMHLLAVEPAPADTDGVDHDLEDTIAGIWRDVLTCEDVQRFDNFFDLGGHSLLAIAVVTRVQMKLQMNIPLTVLFEQPVLADFARAIEQLRAPATVTNPA